MAKQSETTLLERVVATNVSRFRNEAGLTQQQLADKAGLDVRYIQRCEREPQNLTLKSIDRIATALGCAPDALLRSSERKIGSPKVSRTQTHVEAVSFVIGLLDEFRKSIDDDIQ